MPNEADPPTQSTESTKSNKSILLFLASLAVSLIIRLIALSISPFRRWRMLGRGHYDAALTTGRPIIYAFWHEDLIGMAVGSLIERNGPVAVMVSRSRDGERLAAVLLRIGATPIRASSSRGGVAGLIEMKRWLEVPGGRRLAALALDGPRGPRRIAKPGIATLARHTNAMIVPVAFHYSRQIVFKSWDRTRLPKPFARVRVSIGEPMDLIANPIEPGAAAAQLTAVLNELHARLSEEGALA